MARADALALDGTRQGGAVGATRLFEAAELRERIFRIEHREVDALEAAELFGSVARSEGDLSCRASVRQALVEAELRADPSVAYRRIYAERARGKQPECRATANRALLGLAGYEPAREALAELDARARDPNPSPAPSASPAAADKSLVVVPSVTAAPSARPEITSIERYGAEDAARVVVHVTHPARFDMSFVEPTADQPPRVVLDLPNVLYRGKKKLPVGGLVERRARRRAANGTRVVLDLRAAGSSARLLPARTVSPRDRRFQGAAALAFGRGARGPRSVRRVVLDPGHGGHDPGATGPAGLREKDVTLDIAHRAAPLHRARARRRDAAHARHATSSFRSTSAPRARTPSAPTS